MCFHSGRCGCSLAKITSPTVTSSWPPRYFVAEWTTMSAPCSIGRHSTGVAKVLSTTQVSPAWCPAAISAGRSLTAIVGLAMVSRNSSLVRGPAAAVTSAGSRPDT